MPGGRMFGTLCSSIITVPFTSTTGEVTDDGGCRVGEMVGNISGASVRNGTAMLGEDCKVGEVDGDKEEEEIDE